MFRQDLRIQDNPALNNAIASTAPILPLYIWSPFEEGNWPPGAASRWWLHHSLESLNRSFMDRGGRLIVRQGDTLSILREIAGTINAKSIVWNSRVEPAGRNTDAAIQRSLTKEGIEVHQFNGSLLFDPEQIQTASGKPFQVFTPFWKACMASINSVVSTPTPEFKLSHFLTNDSESIANLNLLPNHAWTQGLESTWHPGETAAIANMHTFIDNASDSYPELRDRPDLEGVSRLSPHLHFGEISPKQIVKAAMEHTSSSLFPEIESPPWAYIRQLGWREFSQYLLFHFPHTQDLPLRPEFSSFPWETDTASMRAWQQGKTGYPLVDAGMRQLWKTGWMHNRVRMVTASFLVKDLLIPWQSGAKWFWDTLVDADLANNTMGWQWTAGCGADAAPYFRIFNPVRQGERFDTEGDYVRRWVPELSGVPSEWIQHPWEAPLSVLQQAGVVLGENYPDRIVDHNFARNRALAALAGMK